LAAPKKRMQGEIFGERKPGDGCLPVAYRFDFRPENLFQMMAKIPFIINVVSPAGLEPATP
jgi:hypothetical protein